MCGTIRDVPVLISGNSGQPLRHICTITCPLPSLSRHTISFSGVNVKYRGLKHALRPLKYKFNFSKSKPQREQENKQRSQPGAILPQGHITWQSLESSLVVTTAGGAGGRAALPASSGYSPGRLLKSCNTQDSPYKEPASPKYPLQCSCRENPMNREACRLQSTGSQDTVE